MDDSETDRGQDRRRHAVVVVITVAVGFLVLNIVLAFGQWDSKRTTFRSGQTLKLALEEGNQRSIYLGPAESEGFSFDVYPSDIDCVVTGPSGDVPVDRGTEVRLLDVWQDHMAVGEFEATSPGAYEVKCEGADSSLVLARPARVMVSWASPQLGLLVALPVMVIAGLLLIIDISLGRRRKRAGERQKAHSDC